MSNSKSARGQMATADRAVLTCIVTLCGVGSVAIAGPKLAPVATEFERVRANALASLGLAGGELVEIKVPATASGTVGRVELVVPIADQSETLVLEPTTIRGSTYSVEIQLADGSYVEVEPTLERTFRGAIKGLAGTEAAATLDDAGIHAMVLMPEGGRYWIEPISLNAAGATPGQHVVYRDEDVSASSDTCMLATHNGLEELQSVGLGDSGDGGVAMGQIYYAELAIDVDHEYFQRYGSVEAVETQIGSIINTMNLQYERDLQIRHVITTIIVRTAEPDPYSTNVPDPLLNQLRTHWTNEQTGIKRDMVQLFTGKDLTGTTIGIAWPHETCTTYSYSVVESGGLGCESFACKTDLSAHELGHNWGADHCSCSSPSYTMNPTITGANRFHPTESIPEMMLYRDSRICIDLADELRRVTISAPTTALAIGDSVQLTAIADFQSGPDEDVTAQAVWTVDPPDLATISPEGLLTATGANVESCVQVHGTYTYFDQVRSAQKSFTFSDPDDPLQVVASDPPDDAIDARQPTDSGGTNPRGWSSVTITLNTEPCNLSTSRFVVTSEGGTLPPPTVVSVQPLGGDAVQLTLDSPIEPGVWTRIDDGITGAGVRLGFLPGDVNGDGTASPVDILFLVDSLNGVGPTLPIWATDIDRSGLAAPADILTLIDLLNGASGFDVWNGVSLP